VCLPSWTQREEEQHPTLTTGKKAWDSLYSTAIDTALINSNPGGYKKRTSPGDIKFISTSISEERG
jgi:hypothetical protein